MKMGLCNEERVCVMVSWTDLWQSRGCIVFPLQLFLWRLSQVDSTASCCSFSDMLLWILLSSLRQCWLFTFSPRHYNENFPLTQLFIVFFLVDSRYFEFFLVRVPPSQVVLSHWCVTSVVTWLILRVLSAVIVSRLLMESKWTCGCLQDDFLCVLNRVCRKCRRWSLGIHAAVLR